MRRQEELAKASFDAGRLADHFHMATPGREVPSASTIDGVLVARDFR